MSVSCCVCWALISLSNTPTGMRSSFARQHASHLLRAQQGCGCLAVSRSVLCRLVQATPRLCEEHQRSSRSGSDCMEFHQRLPAHHGVLAVCSSMSGGAFTILPTQSWDGCLRLSSVGDLPRTHLRPLWYAPFVQAATASMASAYLEAKQRPFPLPPHRNGKWYDAFEVRECTIRAIIAQIQQMYEDNKGGGGGVLLANSGAVEGMRTQVWACLSADDL